MIVVTGATGTVGRALLEELAASSVTARVLVRNPQRAVAARRLGMQIAVGSFEDKSSLRAALDGAERLFLLSPAGTDTMVRQQTTVVDIARECGVRHVVKVSSIGADETDVAASIIRAHRDIERHIEASGMSYTHLRPHWFAQNELGHAPSIVADGKLYAPDVTQITSIDARDIAAAAAHVLTHDGHERKAYVLTGPEALSYADVAATLTDVLGHPVRWIEVSLEAARDSMLDAGLARGLATGFTEIMARYRDGGATATVSPAIEALLGRPPRRFEEFARDHRAAFARSAVPV